MSSFPELPTTFAIIFDQSRYELSSFSYFLQAGLCFLQHCPACVFGVFIFFCSWKNYVTAQIVQSAGKSSVYHFNGSASATDNGISLIPTFSLG
jgi:hypothetical protein